MPNSSINYGYAGTDIPLEYLVAITIDTVYGPPEGLIQEVASVVGEAASWIWSIGTGIGLAGKVQSVFTPYTAETGVVNSGSKKYEEYHITITAPIQGEVAFDTQAEWSANVATDLIKKAAGQTTEALTGRSLVSKFVSRRQWSGTHPLKFSLDLKFTAITNSMSEVILPCVELQRMILPSERGFLGKFFLHPPGPDPFYIENISSRSSGEIINVYIGKFMKITKVVPESVTLKYSPKFLKGGHPLEIIATVKFQTFELLTKESISKDLFGGSSQYNYNLKETK